MIKFLSAVDVQKLINDSVNGKNKKFLQQSHNLWYRFKNYEKNKPFAIEIENKIVSIIFATTSLNTKYINLYEICTMQGHEGKGYGTKVWSEFIKYWHNQNMSRIKLSCTPSSITWHLRNGLVFWAVDKQGSLRSDQPLKSTIDEQINLRENYLKNIQTILPPLNICKKLKKESLETAGLSKKKSIETYNAIQKVGVYWLRKYLFNERF